MSRKSESLTPRQRLTRGLTYSAVGPVDVTRGVVGLGLHSAWAGATGLRRRYRERRRADELAATSELMTSLPLVLPDTGRTGRRRAWVLVGVGVVVLAGGAAAFAVVRRSARPEESSARPPSVDVQPRP